VNQTISHVWHKLRHYHSVTGVTGIALFLLSKLLGIPITISKRVKSIKHPVRLRIGTSDVTVLKQVLIERHYDHPMTRAPGVIIDAGANIGLSAVFFANQYPEALIIAIEPESSNFRMLQKNTSGYSRIRTLQAALWFEERDLLSLVQTGSNDGFQVVDANQERAGARAVRGLTVEGIMREVGATSIDILKVDIEGSEKEIFQHASSWIDRVGVIMVELHDRIRAGCSESFAEATRKFRTLPSKGEIVVSMNPRHRAFVEKVVSPTRAVSGAFAPSSLFE
jgi:FkbM family methyltransferase